MMWYVIWLGGMLVGWLFFWAAVDPMGWRRKGAALAGATLVMIAGAAGVVATNQDVATRSCIAELDVPGTVTEVGG